MQRPIGLSWIWHDRCSSAIVSLVHSFLHALTLQCHSLIAVIEERGAIRMIGIDVSDRVVSLPCRMLRLEQRRVTVPIYWTIEQTFIARIWAITLELEMNRSSSQSYHFHRQRETEYRMALLSCDVLGLFEFLFFIYSILEVISHTCTHRDPWSYVH